MITSSLIDAYRAHVQGLEPNEHLDDEVYLALNDRDAIDENWSSLDAQQKQDVERVDELLVRKAALVARVLPDEHGLDPRRWWWLLRQDPQARQRAKHLAA